MSKTSDEIEHAVRSALSDDPRLPFNDEIAVDVYHGVVTLRGTVGSFGQERAAVAAARRQPGVEDVYDQLQVRLLDDPMLDADYLDVRVKDAWVTLTGHADRQFQSDKAFEHMLNLRGVTGVTNEITVDQRLP